jgi:hypothetical protein
MSMKRNLLFLSIALALSFPAYAESPELAELREEIRRMKQEYENRIRVLEERLQSAGPAAAKPATPADTPASTARTAATGVAGYGANVGLVLNARHASLQRDPATYALPGFLLPKEAGPGQRGLALGESELSIEGNIDPHFFGSATLAYATEGAETKTHLEEAYVATTALPHGFTVKGGRFNSRIGYLNEFHRHADDFTDRPLPYRAMLANRGGDAGVYADDGLQVRWVAPTETFFELGAELFRGESFPAGGARRDGQGAVTAFAHLGGDIGVEHSWRAGLSTLHAEAGARASGDDRFTGTGRLWIADFIWKWAPDGNPRTRQLKLQAEYFRRHEQGLFNGQGYAGTQNGWYAQAVYRFLPRWSAGLREDRLSSSNRGATVAGSALDNLGHSPRRDSLMLEYAPSEFSRVRLQYNRDRSRVVADNQWYLQYIMSLGAHRPHSY